MFDGLGSPARPKAASGTPTCIYTVPCASEFRQRVLALAARRGTTVHGLARGSLALVGAAGHPDVGDPGGGGPEPVVISCRDGRSRRIQRQSSLRLRLPAGLDAAGIRRLLALALLLEDPAAARLCPAAEIKALGAAQQAAQQAAERLKTALQVLAFRPLRDGVRTPRQASYVLGFLHEFGLDRTVVTSRFRALAPLFHPDTGVVPDGDRMRQLVEARNLLLRG